MTGDFGFSKRKIFLPLKTQTRAHHAYCFQYKLRGWVICFKAFNLRKATLCRCAESFPTLGPIAMPFLSLVIGRFKWITNKDLL